MARRKTRWMDGDTRAEPFVFVRADEAKRLGLVSKDACGFANPSNPAFEGDFYDSDEVARARLLCRYRTTTTTDPPDELGCRWWVGVGAVVVYHVAVILHLILVGAI